MRNNLPGNIFLKFLNFTPISSFHNQGLKVLISTLSGKFKDNIYSISLISLNKLIVIVFIPDV